MNLTLFYMLVTLILIRMIKENQYFDFFCRLRMDDQTKSISDFFHSIRMGV